jgi:L-cysteine:1D-myo-inositol 2-amino-2-deoxy-alpha-D-glucopyranoside ligase
MRLFDTFQNRVVDFCPPHVVRMYTCGITPYDAAHLGHVATYLYYDVLQRRLRDLGHETRCVRNITDIDDDMFAKSRQLGVDYRDLARQQVAYFDDVLQSMSFLPSYSEPYASSAIAEILDMIATLENRGHCYVVDGAVYFAIATDPTFGALSHLGRSEMLALATERGGYVDDPNKRDPLDFVLWQRALIDEPSWSSPWGPGRPGWHIECSALALREHASDTIDLHGGGSDLVFPHHECERAQSESASGEVFVRHWMHVAMVRLDGVKMSKSLGNLVFVSDLLNQYEAAAIRIAILDNHYRTSWDWKHDMVNVATSRLAMWRKNGAGTGALEAVRNALDDDLDTPTALVAIDAAAARGEGISDAAALLGVSLDND